LTIVGVDRLTTFNEEIMTMEAATLDAVWSDIRILWDFNQMRHQLKRCSVGIGVGSHDPNVPTYTAELFHLGIFPKIVFTGANAPTTVERFPRGEAVHFREMALEHGVSDDVILVEPRATNTEENITYSLDLLAENDVEVTALMLVTRPYQQRRAYATCKKLRPDLDVVCASKPMSLVDYYRSIDNPDLVTNMLVGDTQRVIEYPKLGLAIEQDVPGDVVRAFESLVNEGFTKRLIQH
jgi:uncharacterized SAM-binding protein YcdF (DUF218 family)